MFIHTHTSFFRSKSKALRGIADIQFDWFYKLLVWSIDQVSTSGISLGLIKYSEWEIIQIKLHFETVHTLLNDVCIASFERSSVRRSSECNTNTSNYLFQSNKVWTHGRHHKLRSCIHSMNLEWLFSDWGKRFFTHQLKRLSKNNRQKSLSHFQAKTLQFSNWLGFTAKNTQMMKISSANSTPAFSTGTQPFREHVSALTTFQVDAIKPK